MPMNQYVRCALPRVAVSAPKKSRRRLRASVPPPITQTAAREPSLGTRLTSKRVRGHALSADALRQTSGKRVRARHCNIRKAPPEHLLDTKRIGTLAKNRAHRVSPLIRPTVWQGVAAFPSRSWSSTARETQQRPRSGERRIQKKPGKQSVGSSERTVPPCGMPKTSPALTVESDTRTTSWNSTTSTPRSRNSISARA